MERVPSEEAIGPEREMPGGELSKSDSSKDEELLCEVAIRKHYAIGGRYEVAPKKDYPQTEQNEHVRCDWPSAHPVV